MKTINFGDVTRGKKRQHNPNQPQIYDNPYRISIIGDSE